MKIVLEKMVMVKRRKLLSRDTNHKNVENKFFCLQGF